MEQILRKYALYGFLFALALSILFVNYKEIEYFDGGSNVISYMPIFEYIITILRYSILGMFAALFVGSLLIERKKEKEVRTYYPHVFIIVFGSAIILSFIFNW